MSALLIAQVVATLYMTGLIWFVQIVHYPLLDRVGSELFTQYHAAHTRLTARVVGPPMLVEAAASIGAVLRPPAGVPGWQPWTGLTLLVVIWSSTALLQVPRHRRLARRFSPSAYRRLVSTNWIRVAGWSLRAVLVLHWIS